jgi:hypothetical protein
MFGLIIACTHLEKVRFLCSASKEGAAIGLASLSLVGEAR